MLQEIGIGAIFNFDWCTLAFEIFFESDAVKLTLDLFSGGMLRDCSLPLVFWSHHWGIDHFEVLVEIYGHHLVVIFGLYVYWLTWWTTLPSILLKLYSPISKDRRPNKLIVIMIYSNLRFRFFSPIKFTVLILICRRSF